MHCFVNTKQGFMHTKHIGALSMHSFTHTYSGKSQIFKDLMMSKIQEYVLEKVSEIVFSKLLLEA